MKHSTALSCVVLSLVGIISSQATTIFDDFDDGNDTAPPWTHIDAAQLVLGKQLGTFSFGPDNKHYQLTGPATASIRQDFTIADGEVRCELSSWNASVANGSSVGILARFDPQTLSGYFLCIDADGSPNLNLAKLVNGANVDGSTSSTKNYSSPPYILQMILKGAQLTCRVYQKGATTNTQIDQIVWTDSNPFTSGITGLLVANDDFPSSTNSASCLFDNFYATDGTVNQPFITQPLISGANFQFSFPAEPGRSYIIESKSSVLQPSWDFLTTYGPLTAGAVRTPTDPLGTGPKFYRVRVADNSL